MTSHYEQEKLGWELHDGLGQQLTALVYLNQRLNDEMKNTPVEQSKILDALNKKVLDALEQSRLISKGLNPVSLHMKGLKVAFEELFESYRKVYQPNIMLQYDNNFHISHIQVTHYLSYNS